ncbi:MAG: hypothetical protein US74_C0003G0010 [Parcubacteria group bacterium GW2011_GWA2_38_13]|nr:MAG: hypothetical protein US74_C0003G0010 [Parcubacteria group bacterium GW2011_GWA2_38_13]
MKNLYWNTKKSGVARVIIFPVGKKYKAICLDFDIIEEASSFDRVEERVREAVRGYVVNICKNNLDDNLLNRHADGRYWKIYERYLKMISHKRQIQRRGSNPNFNRLTLNSWPVQELMKQQACPSSC